MNSRSVATLLTLLTATGLTGSAFGQARVVTGEDVMVGYQGLPNRAPRSGETGLQVSDGVLMHLGVGAEVGYDSNVFYNDDFPRSSPIVRVLPFLELTNATRAGAVPSGLYFNLNASLTYREYLSNDAEVKDQRAFMPSASATLDFSSNQSLSFLVGDAFNRFEDPPYVPSQVPIVRDTNQAIAQLRWSPGGGRLASTLRYTNTVDYFENNNLPGSMGHSLLLDTSWKWLPKTAIFVSVQQGYLSYFDNAKPASYPLHAMAGLRGLITSKLALRIEAGYANGFYASGPTPSGFRGNLSTTGELTYRPTVTTTAILGYRHDFQASVLGNFYYLDAVYLNIGQAIAGRVALGLSGRYESRSFEGIVTTSGLGNRHDNYWQVGANLDYHIRAWTYVGVAYTLMANNSDQVSDPMALRINYTKHLLMARLGVTY